MRDQNGVREKAEFRLKDLSLGVIQDHRCDGCPVSGVQAERKSIKLLSRL